jgi:opacity protein-like surface antigen
LGLFKSLRLTLFLAVLATTANVFALTGLGLGVKGGVVSNYKNPNLKLSTYKLSKLKYFAGFVKFGGSGFNLEIGAEYYWDKKKLPLLGQLHEVQAKDFFLTATGKFFLNFPIVRPFIGAGVGAHHFTYTYSGVLDEYQNVTITIPGNKTYFGYHIVVGAQLAIAILPFDLFVEGKIGRVNTSGDPTDFTVFCGGIVFNLP